MTGDNATRAELLEALASQAVRLVRAEAECNRLREEVAELKLNVVAFCAPWAVEHARQRGLPPGHLHPTHYDILSKAGARMHSFTRAALEEAGA